MSDDSHLEEIPVEECLELAGSVPVGRLGFIAHGQPMVLPVNHAIDGGEVVFRTARGSKLDVALQQPGAIVVFEVDDWDEDTRTGWSVVIRGRLEPILELTTAARLDRLGLRTWVHEPRRIQWLRIEATEITGRRLTDER